jgi:cell fate (sporulation/competence/biofilm development) regulator YlbF (YheA/YmcA/DUF963 family)
MEVMELAAQIGKAIKEHEVYKKYLEAKEAYDNNEVVNDKIMEYGIQQQALAIEAGKEDHDEALMDQIQKRLDALYTEICEDATFLALNAAQEAVNELMNQVNQTINYNITGEKPCTHDCSTCGGCH